MQAFKVRTVFSTSSSRSQGLVEKYNGTVKKLLSRAQASQTGKVDWAKEAREITLAHNTTPSPARAGHSPCDLAMPRYGSLAAQLDGPTPSPVVRGSAIDGDWIGAGDPDHLDVKEAREAVRATEQAVAATIDRRATGMVTRSSSQLPPLKVGDKVRVRLSALDPAKRRAEKAKFEKDSLGVFWTRRRVVQQHCDFGIGIGIGIWLPYQEGTSTHPQGISKTDRRSNLNIIFFFLGR